MNDRTFKALARAGIAQEPIASLDYEQQLFALTPHHLIFEPQEGGVQQQVLLRDITRIHSDQAGTLRIEAGSATAITASLLGYDPNRVQRFFQLVRDTTARAKQMPPAPAAPSQGFFSKPAAPTAAPTSVPVTVPLAEQLAAAPRPAVGAPVVPTAPFRSPPAPTPAAPADNDNIIRIGAQAGSVTAAPVAVEAPASVQPMAQPSKANLEKVTSEAAPLAEPQDEVKPAKTTVTAEPTLLSHTELLRRARAVGGLSATVRVLAVVLALGSLGMGYVLWQQEGQNIPALWTVTMGIVTAVALLVLAEVLRYFTALGQSVAEQSRGR